MIRLRNFYRTPYGVRPLAAGLMLAAAGVAPAAPSAVETLDAAAARELEAADDDSMIRPIAGTADAGMPRPLPADGEPGPIARRYQLTQQLNDAYERDSAASNAPVRAAGREVSGRTGSGSTHSGIRQVSSPPGGSTSSRPASSSSRKKSGNRFTSLFSLGSSGGAKSTSSRRPSKPSSTSTVSSGGLFGKMLRPFRGEEEKAAAYSEQPPVPPPLPYFDSSSKGTKHATAPPKAPAPGGAPLMPPAYPSSLTGPAAPPPALRPEPGDDDPFAQDEAAAPEIAINPAYLHPLEDAFSDVRGTEAPDATEIADLDPEFTTPVQIYDHGAPRPLDPEVVSTTDEPDSVSTADEFAPVQISVPAADVAPPVAQQSPAARLAELQRKLAERSGLGGFQGFCPVALRDRRELIDARPEFLSVHQNRTYELSSAEAKARFEADPTRYAPAGGGNDVVLMSRGETEAEGSLTYAVWFKDRLYIFRTAETMREFNEEPTKYAVSE